MRRSVPCIQSTGDTLPLACIPEAESEREILGSVDGEVAGGAELKLSVNSWEGDIKSKRAKRHLTSMERWEDKREK